jgi:hypothetical protein
MADPGPVSLGDVALCLEWSSPRPQGGPPGWVRLSSVQVSMPWLIRKSMLDPGFSALKRIAKV